MLLLCSNGLSSPALLSYLSARISCGRAALVVTADHEYKENNYHVARCVQELQSLNLQVDIVDVEKQSAEDLLEYDVVEFIGGNPYYLLRVLRKQNAREILQRIAAEKILIGWSAGALVMTPTIGIIDEFSPEMNLWGITDLSGMSLTEIQIIPHYGIFIKRYDRLEERCREYEAKHHCTLVRLNDGEGIAIDAGKVIYPGLGMQRQ